MNRNWLVSRLTALVTVVANSRKQNLKPVHWGGLPSLQGSVMARSIFLIVSATR